MSRDGSGSYSLPAGQPVVTGTVISSTVFNTFASDVASALTASIAKDGQTTPTADLPMGTFKHTGVGNGSARTHYPAIGQIQDDTLKILSGVANTNGITGSLTPAITTYATGMMVVFKPIGANSAAVTIAINGLTAKSITKFGATALVAGDLATDVPAFIIYDGAAFQLLNPQTVVSALNASNLTSGTVPDARFPATLPAASGVNLTALNGTNIASGTVAAARLAAALTPTTVELGHASDTTLSRASAGVVAVEGSNVLMESTGMKQGLATIPIMAAAMQSADTNGAAAGVVETTTNKVLYRTLDFDTTTQEFAGFVIPMPKSYNDSTVTFQPLWTAASGSGTVVWALQAVALSNDDAIDTAYGTEQTSTDTLLTAGDVHVGPTSSAITIAGTPATDDLIFFRIKRVPASDTLAVDAQLIGIRLYFTQNAADDT